MTRLSVNINKIATLRNARGGDVPNLIEFAKDCEQFGAEGITIHPRPDERHITRNDVYELKKNIKTELNIEGYPDSRFMSIIDDIRPQQVTLVPDPPDVLTSNSGWDTKKNESFLKEIIAQLHTYKCRVSVFMDVDPSLIEICKKINADRIELYTGPYAMQFKVDRDKAVKPYEEAVIHAKKLDLGINAGHDLNLQNLNFLFKKLAKLDEVSIGHAIISDALYFGIENTIQMYKSKLE